VRLTDADDLFHIGVVEGAGENAPQPMAFLQFFRAGDDRRIAQHVSDFRLPSHGRIEVREDVVDPLLHDGEEIPQRRSVRVADL